MSLETSTTAFTLYMWAVQ